MSICTDRENIGGLSNTTKMPCKSWGVPAYACNVGKASARNTESVCSRCYAKKGSYCWGSTQRANDRRLKALEECAPNRMIELQAIAKSADFVSSFVRVLKAEKTNVFRWFDTGDLQGVYHLAMICEICEANPNMRHWLPTREIALVAKYTKSFALPKNLVIRISSGIIGRSSRVVATHLGAGIQSSLVSRRKLKGAFACPSTWSKETRGCNDCRKCWSRRIREINYKLH